MPMKTAGTQHFIERTYRESGTFQWARETYKNAEEATLDFGVLYSTYSHYSHGGARKSYGEVYAGIARGAFSSRIFLSPHYSEAGLWTAYGEINGHISPARKWSLDAHAGMLLPLRSPNNSDDYRPAFDARLGVSREFGPLSLHASWVLGKHGREYYGDRSRGGSAFVLGATWAL